MKIAKYFQTMSDSYQSCDIYRVSHNIGSTLFFVIISGYGSVHNYSTYPMLLYKCSKNVVFLNEIGSEYVVNWGKK